MIICLIGGGQEINQGEAGIGLWLSCLLERYPEWRLYISDQLKDAEYAVQDYLKRLETRQYTHFVADLHLNVSMRSFRAEMVSNWVKQVLDFDTGAIDSYQKFKDKYPIKLCRDLKVAKQWLKNQARGSERYGIVASSKAYRLRPLAIDVRYQINPVHWFLNDREDVRSSYYLEDAATEFKVQGLELDWVCVSWDGDLRYSPDGWQHWSFEGSKWKNIRKEERKAYLKNAYRVLLTRARQGMVILVPEGNDEDHTRKREFYDDTYKYLKGLGVEEI
ncbi:MAG: DUF2075 domain-containing protein [Candidatus Cloacimonetes bacterium]|nr:DUF2075 domain-containing protein [Candidatus Cloacimonadota bacterium]